MTTYSIRTELKPSGLIGISDKQIDEHWKLYEGYVNQSNALVKELKEMREAGQGASQAYADRRRRFEFEFTGMVVHEYYFGNMKAGVSKDIAKNFTKLVAQKYGSFEAWAEDFKNTGLTRGVGHAICYLDPLTGDVNNHFIALHGEGHIPGYHPLVALDVWEHAYMVDQLPSGRGTYIDAFMENVNWGVVEARVADAWNGVTSLRFEEEQAGHCGSGCGCH